MVVKGSRKHNTRQKRTEVKKLCNNENRMGSA